MFLLHICYFDYLYLCLKLEKGSFILTNRAFYNVDDIFLNNMKP